MLRQSWQLENLTLVTVFLLIFKLSSSLTENFSRFGIKRTFPFIFKQNSHKSLWPLCCDPEKKSMWSWIKYEHRIFHVSYCLCEKAALMLSPNSQITFLSSTCKNICVSTIKWIIIYKVFWTVSGSECYINAD